MLPNRNATRLKLKKPIRPQFMAPTTAMVRAKYCRHLFAISHHPFVIQEIVFHGIEKNIHGNEKKKKRKFLTVMKNHEREISVLLNSDQNICLTMRVLYFSFRTWEVVCPPLTLRVSFP